MGIVFFAGAIFVAFFLGLITQHSYFIIHFSCRSA